MSTRRPPNDVNATLDARALDAALAEWPDAARSEAYWEELAARVEERIARGDRRSGLKDVTDEKILAPPLPWIAEDGHKSAASASSTGQREPRMGMQPDRERERRSFQDLAKMAAPSSSNAVGSVSRTRRSEPGAASGDDSGLIDLKSFASNDPGAMDRASLSPPPPGEAAADSVEPGTPRGSEPPRASHPALAPAPSAPGAVVAAASVVPIAAAAPARSSSRKLALGLGFVAVAAASFLAARMIHPASPVAANTTPTETRVEMAPPPPRAAAAAAATPTSTTPVAESAPTTAAKSDAVDPSSLPTPNAASALASNTNKKTAAKSAARGTSSDDAPARSDGVPAALQAAMGGGNPAAAAPKPVKNLPPSSPASDSPLGDAIKDAVGSTASASTAAPTPAAAPVAPMGTVSQRPSQGAVSGALGAVLPEARGCLGPDDPVSRARVVFGSSGSVQSVTVSGGAAGKPQEACIKAALGKAKVPPFAESDYPATITVRP